MARDGPEAGRDKLARVFTLLPEHRLLHVGHDLEDDAEDVEGPADVVLRVNRFVAIVNHKHLDRSKLNFHYLGPQRRIPRLFVEHNRWQEGDVTPLEVEDSEDGDIKFENYNGVLYFLEVFLQPKNIFIL